MREKRTWPPREKDADSSESAAFEATVAVVKETVVRSGEVLVSAKEDLTDHKRWLEAQRAAVLADRARHERWLQKQKEKQDALERRERARRRRKLMRENAMRAVEDAAFAVLDFFISLFWRSVWKVKASLGAARDAILRGLAWWGGRFRDLGLYLMRLAGSAASAAAAKARQAGGAAGLGLSAAGSSIAARCAALARSAGAALAAASSAVGAKSGALTRVTGRALSSARSSAATKWSELASAAGLHPAAMRSPVPDAASEGGREREDMAAMAEPAASARSARAAPALLLVAGTVRTSVERLVFLIQALSVPAAAGAKSASRKVSAASAAAYAKLQASAPGLHAAIGKAAEQAKLHARAASGLAGTLIARIKPPLGEGENEVSSSAEVSLAGARARGDDLSHMLIISGVVLLVCGSLLLVSGLVLRTGGGLGSVASSVASLVEKPPSPHAVEWFFEAPELPIAERSVFSAELTPKGVRLTGLAIKAENNSDDVLSGVEGVVKPDLKRGDLKLAVRVDMVPADGEHGAEAADAQTDGAVPAHAFFSLVVPFPPEAHGEDPGIALDDFIAAYGGLMLKLRYEAAGTQKSLIHYLSPEMLKAQLTEIQHEAKGS
jgi:hypothetical protein